MSKHMPGSLALCGWLLVLSACASAPEPPRPTARASSAVEATSCDEALLYETADAHPDIRWGSARPGVSGDAVLGCLLTTDTDSGTIETVAYMSSGLYKFVRECRPNEQRTYRVFEYKNKGRPYPLRLHKDPFVDPKTYIVVSSFRIPTGTYRHSIAESSNSAAQIVNCPPAEASLK